MKLFYIILTWFYISFSFEKNQEQIKFVKKLYEFGNVKVDIPISYRFYFTNILDSDFKLVGTHSSDVLFSFKKKSKDSSIYKSYSQITTDWSTIKKNDSVCIIATYTPRTEGIFYKKINVLTSVDSVVLAITGTVYVSDDYKRKKIHEKLKETACDNITKSVDDFTGEISFITNDFTKEFQILKFIKGKTNTYYLSFQITDSYVVVDGKGVTLLFSDGTKLSKPSEKIKIDINSDGKGYDYSAFVKLTPQDIITLSKKKIIKFRLYIFDRELELVDSELIPLIFECMKTLK